VDSQDLEALQLALGEGRCRQRASFGPSPAECGVPSARVQVTLLIALDTRPVCDSRVHAERITDIPDEVELGQIPDRIREVMRSGQPFVSSDLGAVLAGLGPPAFYLDFETMSPAIPRYPLTRPYERIPFQWSVHQIGTDGQLFHREFLADGRDDPRRELAEELLALLGGRRSRCLSTRHSSRAFV
jgi:Domain of unknown function(DUF2779)